MTRRTASEEKRHMKRLVCCAITLFVLVVGADRPFGQAQPSSPEVIVVMTASADPKASQEELRAAALRITAELRKLSGAIDDQILQSQAGGSAPKYLLVMRWRQLKDWEAMLANTE